MAHNKDLSSVIEASVSGDRRAQRELFDCLKISVSNQVWHMIGPCSQCDLEDTIQKIFVEFFKSLPRFKGRCSPQTWISQIGMRVCMTEIRNKYRKGSIAERDALHEVDALADTQDHGDPAITIKNNELSALIEKALAHLKPEFRAALVLVDIEEKTMDEAALELSLPVGTLKSRLFRARQEIREQLKSYQRD